jgi:NAD(P)-dependent dehydrogenase (short-subunit alcohol dehydrogenase family)
VLFVNAGVIRFAQLAEMPESAYDEQFDINIKGAYFTIQKALPMMNNGASIILNTSESDTKGHIGTSAYSASKAALRSLARTAAAELVGRAFVSTPWRPDRLLLRFSKGQGSHRISPTNGRGKCR